ncbi:MAG: putative Acyl-CoA dehydrogenase, short-chain specific [Rhizobacter sp.]|nr:putative Acyl-CoA dehydrogenase, short-chain specific [Rhizobacter sp.]
MTVRPGDIVPNPPTHGPANRGVPGATKGPIAHVHQGVPLPDADRAGVNPTSLDAATGELLAGSLRELFASLTDGRRLGNELDQLGWDEVLAEDPAWATTLLFTEHGRSLASSRALDDILLAELSPVLPAATGPRALLYPDPADADVPASSGGALRGLLLGDLTDVAEVVVPFSTPDGVGLLVVSAAALQDQLSPAAAFDPAIGWQRVADAAVPAGPSPVPAAVEWERAVAAGHRAVAAELIGICEAALALAVEHTSARFQYGRAIASFQAVRHRLSEAHVAIASARSMLDAAWTAAGRPDGPWAARLAKVRAGRAQAEVMRHGVQVLGAMGLTRESDMHRFVTRAAALDALLGGHRALTGALGADLLAGADLLPVVEI